MELLHSALPAQFSAAASMNIFVSKTTSPHLPPITTLLIFSSWSFPHHRGVPRSSHTCLFDSFLIHSIQIFSQKVPLVHRRQFLPLSSVINSHWLEFETTPGSCLPTLIPWPNPCRTSTPRPVSVSTCILHPQRDAATGIIEQLSNSREQHFSPSPAKSLAIRS